MESNHELKEVNIKHCTCCCFDGIIKIEDFYFDYIIIDEKSNKEILVFDILYKTLFGSKPIHIRSDQVDVFIRVYDGIRYLVLIIPEKHDAICNRIKYFISQKSGNTYVLSHNYAKSRLIHMILYL